MIVRTIEDSDIPNIVKLLKLSLGQNSTPKTESLWKWKHYHNPFGISKSILAEEDNRIIGIRTFMRWNWYMSGTTINSLRAVDTATHPDYFGKGVFKKLTKALLREIFEDDFEFIYNTPNKKSKNGYLKLGWKSLGKTSITFSVNLRNLKIRPLSPDLKLKEFLIDNDEIFSNSCYWEYLLENKSSFAIAKYSPEFIKWRYFDCPVHNYYKIISSGSDPFLIIFRIIPRKYGRELRFEEIFIHPKLTAFEELRLKLREIVTATKPTLILLHSYVEPDRKKLIEKVFQRSIDLQLGPELIINKINLKSFSLIPGENWLPSIGDLELF